MNLHSISFGIAAIAAALAFAGPAAASARAAETAAPLKFQEVYDALRANLPGVTEADLDRAAVQGLLSNLKPQITLVTNLPTGASLTDLPLITKTSVFENAFGYLRVSHVAQGLGKAVESAVAGLRKDQKLSGLVLDLRNSGGSDYLGAVEVADAFLDAERALLRLGGTNLSAPSSEKTMDLPVAVLLNDATMGSAEALAASLQFTRAALLIGSRTAGEAHTFKEIELSGGQRLRLPGEPALLADGTALAPNGVTPDILISVNREDEKMFFDDPYWISPRLFSQTGRSNTNELSGASTNRARRINEADLVRMQREGQRLDQEQIEVPNVKLPPTKIVNDPALARALDFLKGLSMTLNRR